MISLDIYGPKLMVELGHASYATTKPKGFFSLFRVTSSLAPTAPATVAGLTAWALDSGYGAPDGIDQEAFLRISPSLRARLGDFQRARLALLMHLLDIDSATGELHKHPVTKHLESSDTSDGAFILGGIGCRYATEAWLKSRGQTLERFWHYAIYSNPAVSGIDFKSASLTMPAAAAAAGATPAVGEGKQDGKRDGDRRPDYLAASASGSWYAVEAKGSFGKIDYSTIRSGMDQARRLVSVSFLDPLTAAPGAAPVRHTIQDYACSCAHFDKGTRLHIDFLDPPVDVAADGADDAGFLDLEIDTTIAQLFQYYRATQQFDSLAGRRTRKNPSMLESSSDSVRWNEVSFSAARRRDAGQKRIWLGIPREIDGRAGWMRTVLRLFVVLAPRLREVFDARALSVGNQTLRAGLDAAMIGLLALSTGKTRQILLRMRAALLDSEAPPPNWPDAMRMLRQVPVHRSAKQLMSIDDVVESMRQSSKTSDFVAMTLRFDTAQRASPPAIAQTQSGLIVVSGAPWKPTPITTSASKLKI